MDQDLWEIKVNGATEFVMRKLAKLLSVSRKDGRLCRIESSLKELLGGAGNTPAEINQKIKLMLPIMGGACEAQHTSARLINEEFIAEIESSVCNMLQ